MNKSKKTKIVFILISLAVGGLSAFLTRNNMNVFDTIQKPPLTPPAIVFPIVWTILFTLMGYSAARVYLEDPKSNAIEVFGVNLVVNFFWSIIFFNLQAYTFAFIWLLLLIAVVVVMIIKFYRVDKAAAFLQLPYLAWLLFAGYLNLYIALMN
ncbi:MAG: tryptophan-rich sensory protein [Oscillospiraceae bacterium]|nr:tryptophan-rich sensory protein [Oscillospiraceae bacterium]MBQ4315860.1 tryptophan-rich sensory protein [Oscillospiraceae bacterium]MBQ7053979.1 tryptophan-rich sensory protein [Oscillospiraceae bacterium]